MHRRHGIPIRSSRCDSDRDGELRAVRVARVSTEDSVARWTPLSKLTCAAKTAVPQWNTLFSSRSVSESDHG